MPRSALGGIKRDATAVSKMTATAGVSAAVGKPGIGKASARLGYHKWSGNKYIKLPKEQKDEAHEYKKKGQHSSRILVIAVSSLKVLPGNSGKRLPPCFPLLLPAALKKNQQEI